MSYTNLLYHIVYATKSRAPLITQTLRPRLHEYLGGTVHGLGGIALEISGTNDHVHLLAKLRPTISVSEFLRKLKRICGVEPLSPASQAQCYFIRWFPRLGGLARG